MDKLKLNISLDMAKPIISGDDMNLKTSSRGRQSPVSEKPHWFYASVVFYVC